MAGYCLVPVRSYTCSPTENGVAQLQLSAPPDVIEACLPPLIQATRKSRPRGPSVSASTNLLLGNRNEKEERLHCGCRPSADISIATSLSNRFQRSSVKRELHCLEITRKHRRSSVVRARANTTADRCSSDADDVASSSQSYWTEEVLSSLQRSLLELQWALQARQSGPCGRESSDLETVTCGNHDESVNTHGISQELASCVVRSGQESARQRRSMARSNLGVVGRRNDIDNAKPLRFANPMQRLVKKKKVRAKLYPVHDFVSSFLKPTNGYGMLAKDEEKDFTRQMRIFQSLEKAKHELRKTLGHEPSYELWARSVNISSEKLLSKVRKGETARDKMICSHLCLVVSVARAYQHLGVDMADLILEGSKGLLRGLDKFDHRKGHKISTYVHWWIRQGVMRAIANHSRLLRVPVYLHEIMFAIPKAKTTLDNQQRPVTIENLSLVLNIPTYKIEWALQAKGKVFSFDISNGPYGLKMFDSLHEFVADSTGKNDPWRMFNEENVIEVARDCLTLLTSREQEVIRWAFGIDTKGGIQSSLTSIGFKLGVSKERVRQLKVRALAKMRRKEMKNNFALLDALDQL